MATASDLTRVPVVVLSENNYNEWAPQIRAWVKMKGHTAVKQHLEPPAGTVYPPVFANDVDGEKLDKWLDRDSVIAGYMISTLTSAQKQHVDDTDSATIIWHKLQAVHHRQGFNGYHSLSRSLEALKYVDGTSMQAHLHAHAELHKRITAAGMSLPEQHYVSVFLAGLPRSWDNIVPSLTSLRSNTQLPLLPAPSPGCDRCIELKKRRLPDNYGCLTGVDWATMSQVVLDEELRRKDQDGDASTDKGTALSVIGSAAKSNGATRSDRRSYTTGVTCAFCRMKNHDHTQCFKLNGYPPGHKLYDVHFVKPTWRPPT
jgi:hypothetical protein